MAELFELARISPSLLSGEIIEQRIRETMLDMVNESKSDASSAKLMIGEMKKEMS